MDKMFERLKILWAILQIWNGLNKRKRESFKHNLQLKRNKKKRKGLNEESLRNSWMNRMLKFLEPLMKIYQTSHQHQKSKNRKANQHQGKLQLRNCQKV